MSATCIKFCKADVHEIVEWNAILVIIGTVNPAHFFRNMKEYRSAFFAFINPILLTFGTTDRTQWCWKFVRPKLRQEASHGRQQNKHACAVRAYDNLKLISRQILCTTSRNTPFIIFFLFNCRFCCFVVLCCCVVVLLCVFILLRVVVFCCVLLFCCCVLLLCCCFVVVCCRRRRCCCCCCCCCWFCFRNSHG